MPKRRFEGWVVFCLGLLVVALGVAVVGKLNATPVQAAVTANPAIYACTPDLIVSANVRVVARCATPYNDVAAGISVYWFAYPTHDSAGASRMLSLLETARATATTVTFYFDDLDTSGAAYGCNADNCRAFWAITAP